MSDFMRGMGAGFSGAGIARAVNNVALAPYLAAIQEQRAKSEAALAALRDAKASREMMSQDMYGRMLGRYNAPDTPVGEKNTLETMIAGMGNAAQLAQARKQGISNAHMMNIAPMDETDPGRIKTAHFAVSEKPAYANANTPGTALNQLDGSTLISNAAAQRAYLDEVRSKIAENRAQAGNASAHANLAGKQGRYRAQSLRRGLDQDMNDPQRQEYLDVRKRAVEKGNSALVKELDELARKKGYF